MKGSNDSKYQTPKSKKAKVDNNENNLDDLTEYHCQEGDQDNLHQKEVWCQNLNSLNKYFKSKFSQNIHDKNMC